MSKTKALIQISLRNNGKLRVTFSTYGKDGIDSSSGEMTWDQVEKLLPNVMPADVRVLKAAQRHQGAAAQAPGLRLDQAVPSSSQAQCKPLKELHGHCPPVRHLESVKERPRMEPGTTVEISIGSPVEPSFLGHLTECLLAAQLLARSIWRLIAHPFRSLFLRISRPETLTT